MPRVRIGLVFGGRSGEHEVSLRSTRSVLEALDRQKFEPVLIGIDLGGRWHLLSDEQFDRLTAGPGLPRLESGDAEIALAPVPSRGELLAIGASQRRLPALDVVFPVLHGPLGEDGTIQGLLELADVPYVGAGVLGSALGMDKDVQKRLLRQAGLPVVDHVAIRCREWQQAATAVRAGLEALPYPLFVKPANLGSSVGVSKVHDATELGPAIDAAFAYDDKIVVEKGVDAREIECSVLGNEEPEVSVPGEICPGDEFYSYDAKYVNEHGATFIIPAPLPADVTAEIRRMAAAAFLAIECEGMARVDFFIERGSGEVLINELNTIPGFTSISQYPRLWEATGLSYRGLLERLIDLAFERHARRRRRAVSPR